MTAPPHLTDDLTDIETAASLGKSIKDFDHAALAAYVVALNPTVLLGLVAEVRESRQKLSDARAALLAVEQARDQMAKAGSTWAANLLTTALATPAPVAVPDPVAAYRECARIVRRWSIIESDDIAREIEAAAKRATGDGK